MKLTFSSIEEFLIELEHAVNAHAVEQGILRVTCRYRGHSDLPYKHCDVVAGYIEIQGDDAPQEVTHRRLVELRAYGGQHWGHGFDETAKTVTRVQDHVERLKRTAQGLGLEVRAGLFEATPTA